MELFDSQAAVVELRRRRQDAQLMSKVENYLGFLPPGLEKRPMAVMARPVATPNFEQMCLPDLALELGLDPAVWEYTGDRFTSLSSEKMHLVRPVFLQGFGRNKGPKTKRHILVDINQAEKVALNQVMTIDGRNLVKLHQELFEQVLPGVSHYDDTEWLKEHGGQAKLYYPYFLSLFICHGVLLEDFTDQTDNSKLQFFVQKIVDPALASIKAQFGLNPLIVPILPPAISQEERWCWYPGSLEAAMVG